MASPPVGPSSGGRSGMSPAEERAYQTERESNRRIAAAEKDVEQARKVADARIDSIHDQYEKREISETERNLELIEKQRMKGYEQVRDLQRQQQAELGRVRRESERELSQLQDHYRTTLNTVEHQGSDRLRSLETRHASELDLRTRSRQDELALAEELNRRQTEAIRAENEGKVSDLREAGLKEYERVRANTNEADEEMRANFLRQFEEKTAVSQQTLDDIQDRASRAIRELRQDTSHKLAAYADRQEDPFYKLLDLQASVSDEGDYYELTARIPEHEQAHVSVSIKGGQIVLSGYRRNEEKLEVGPGHSRGTNSFQSFLETFPLAWPVDAKKLSREFEGERLTVRVPKKSDLAYRSPTAAAKPARARVERPKFPENLPLAKTETAPGSDAEAPPARAEHSPKPRTTKTLI